MPENAEKRARHSPLVVVDTENLSREEWLACRRQGIGGSDVAGIMGISPFRTARDIYYDKLNIASVEEEPENWVALEVGNLLEDLVAEIFHKKSGLEIFQVKKMFRHPLYSFMLADVDYFVRLPDGETAILEIKTTNYNATDAWWQDGREAVPPYYEAQGRHYMAVMDADRVFFCCLYGNTEDESIIREIRRDMAYEQEMVYLEQYFWENHVLAKNPPPYTEDSAQILGSVQRYCGPADTGAPVLELGADMTETLMYYLRLQEEKKKAEKRSGELERELQRAKAILIAEMGTSCTAECRRDGFYYTVTYNPVRKAGVDKNNLSRLKIQYPEIYERFVTVSEYRRFLVKVSAEEAA